MSEPVTIVGQTADHFRVRTPRGGVVAVPAAQVVLPLVWPPPAGWVVEAFLSQACDTPAPPGGTPGGLPAHLCVISRPGA